MSAYVLRPAGGSDQSTLLGWHRVCASVQAAGREAVSVAPERAGVEATDEAGVPLAHGGTVHRPEESHRAGKTGNRLLTKNIEKTMFPKD